MLYLQNSLACICYVQNSIQNHQIITYQFIDLILYSTHNLRRKNLKTDTNNNTMSGNISLKNIVLSISYASIA